MIDLHCHLLPGIDDGAKTLEDAVAMCRMAVDDGITVAVATPHIHPGRWPNSKEVIRRSRDELKSELEKRGIPLRLGFAAEVRLTDNLMAQVQNEQIPFYGEVEGYKLMLLEFPHGHIVPGSDKIVRWLLERGIRPMIAHPERNRRVMKDISVLDPFLEAGCWLQGTAGSLLGDFGERALNVIEHLVLSGKLTTIASDGHNVRARPPKLSAGLDRAVELIGREKAYKLVLKTCDEPFNTV